MEVGDLDGDGRPDIAAASRGGAPFGSSNIVRFDQGIPGRFHPARELAVTGGVASLRNHLTLGDLDGDGELDLVTSFHGVLWGGLDSP